MLDPDEQRQTSIELRANLAASGLTQDEVCLDLGCTSERLDAATRVTGADPVDVWMLRDYLVQAVRDSGGEPTPFTVLTDTARRQAAGWFRLRSAPRHRSRG